MDRVISSVGFSREELHAALDDLDRLATNVPRALRWALQKMLLLEESLRCRKQSSTP